MLKIHENQNELNDAEYLVVLRRQMHKFAVLQLADSESAEDAVQEALMSALKNQASFKSRASLKAWVFAILKNKIADILRQNKRFVFSDGLPEEIEVVDGDGYAGVFNKRGYWQSEERPSRWGNPQDSLQQTQFWKIFEICLEGLPGKQARVFMMREFVELDPVEICSAVGISSSNLNVMLYRARLKLRACLEHNWFKEGGAHTEL